MLKNQRTVYIETVGICEHCSTVVTMEGMPVDSMNAEWKCSECNGTLTNKSFGYRKVKGEWKKTRWIGEDGKWTRNRPTGGFDLGSWFITTIAPLRSYF